MGQSKKPVTYTVDEQVLLSRVNFNRFGRAISILAEVSGEVVVDGKRYKVSGYHTFPLKEIE